MKRFGKFLLATAALATAATGVYLYLKDKGLLPSCCSCDCNCNDTCCSSDEEEQDRTYVSLNPKEDLEDTDDDFDDTDEDLEETFENMSEAVNEEADSVEEFFDDESKE